MDPVLNRVPRWTIWSVVGGLVVAVGINLVVERATAEEPLDRTNLERYVVQPSDVGGLDQVGSFTEVDLGLDSQSEAIEVVSVVFAHQEIDPGSVLEAVQGWAPGDRLIVSEVMSFESGAAASEFLDGVWSTYTRGAREKQRGPDGSLLMFHPDFERTPGAPGVPTAVAAWPIEGEVLIITVLGADSATDVLDFARLVDERRDQEQAG